MARGFLGRAIDASAAALGLEKDADGNFQVKLDGATIARGANGLRIGTVNLADLADGGDVFKHDGSVQATGDFDMNGNTVTGLAAPSASSDAATKGYVDQQVTQGRSWKEVLLIPTQLASGNGTSGIYTATAYYLTGKPAADDNLLLRRDGQAPEAWVFKANRTGAGEITIGANAAETLDNVVTAVNTDSAAFEAVASTVLDAIASKVVVFRATDLSYTALRIYSTTNSGAVQRYVDYSGEYDYQKSSGGALPNSDPGQGSPNFGMYRGSADVKGGHTHPVRSDDNLYIYDSDSYNWTNIPGTVYTAGDGLTLNAGEFAIVLSAGGGLTFVAGELALDMATDFVFTGNCQFGSPVTIADATATGEAAALGQVVITVLERIASEVTDTSVGTDALTDTLTLSPINADACVLYVDRQPCFGMAHLAGTARDFSLGGAGNKTITWIGQQGGANAVGFDLTGDEIIIAQYAALASADVSGQNAFGDVLGHPAL